MWCDVMCHPISWLVMYGHTYGHSVLHLLACMARKVLMDAAQVCVGVLVRCVPCVNTQCVLVSPPTSPCVAC